MMVPGNIAAENKLKFSKLDQKYSNCTIDLIDMDDKFADCPVTHWPSVIYYKLSMPSILRDVDKCIYIDGDTIVKHDLSDMYYVDMKDYYVAGVNPEPYVVDEYFGCEYGSDGFQRVCDGILVWNLKKAREDDLETKFQELVESNNKEKKFMFGSEDIICITCKEKILSLPHKYGLFSSAEYIYWPWWDFEDWYDAQNDPVIVHYVDINKPWNGLSMGCGKLWWDYAKKTDIYGEIKAKYAGNLNDIAKYIYDI
jgi:lipopolysaccharide biosynthesis glycosyltransferase